MSTWPPPAAARSISIPRGKSAIIDLPVDARDVLVTNPQVADAVLRTPRRIYVMGVEPGVTDAAFFDAAGRRILALNIRVDQDFSAVAQTINRLIPGAQVHVESVNDSIVLSGEVADPVRRRQGGSDRPAIHRQAGAGGQSPEHRRQGAGDAESAHRGDAAQRHQAARLQSQRPDRPAGQPAVPAQFRRPVRRQRLFPGEFHRRLRSGHHPAA